MVKVFDKVYCLTLENNTERQENAKKELEKIGIKEFEFFYGVTPKDEVVKNAYRKGLVKPFPNCFRCNRPTCQCVNNFLIPSQIACFQSFLNLFQKISEDKNNHTFLIVEDDVEFETYAKSLISKAFTEAELKESLFYSDFPVLYSLGQNYFANAKKNTRRYRGYHGFAIADHTEGNVTFACNKPFANLALQSFHKFEVTSDTYIHNHMGHRCHHRSLHPKISHDLSWSVGKVASHIHPKKEYIRYHAKDLDKMQEEIKRYRNHVKRVNSKEEYNKFIQEYLNSP